MTTQDLDKLSQEHEDSIPNYEWDEGGGFIYGNPAAAYEAGFKKALELILSNGLVYQGLRDCTIKELMSYIIRTNS